MGTLEILHHCRGLYKRKLIYWAASCEQCWKSSEFKRMWRGRYFDEFSSQKPKLLTFIRTLLLITLYTIYGKDDSKINIHIFNPSTNIWSAISEIFSWLLYTDRIHLVDTLACYILWQIESIFFMTEAAGKWWFGREWHLLEANNCVFAAIVMVSLQFRFKGFFFWQQMPQFLTKFL